MIMTDYIAYCGLDCEVCECGTPAVQEGHFIRTGKEKNRKDIEVWK